MRKTFAIGMSVLLAASCMPVYAESTQTETETASVLESASEKADGTYQLGDKIDDFTVTLSDGSEVSLYQLLETKKAVLINLWASWCGPCKSEFPVMQEAYDEMSDDIGIVALSIEKSDTDEIVNQLKDDLGLTTLPMGVDTIGLKDRFNTDAIPVSIMVDRNGVICFIENGAITDKGQFERLFETFTADDYDEPQLLDSIPTPLPDVEAPSAEEMQKAVGTEDMVFTGAEKGSDIWPFVLSDDGTSLVASNGDQKGTMAAFAVSVNTQEGQALSYEYETNCLTYYEGLYVSVDGEVQTILSGEDKDWTNAYVTFDEPGEHTVYFAYTRSSSVSGETDAAVRNFQLVSAEDAQKLAEEQKGVKTLEGSEISIEPIEGELKNAILSMTMDGQSADDAKGVYPVMQGDTLTIRISIGEDLDANDVFYTTDGTYYHMLSELPTDDKGYLYTVDVADVDLEAAMPMVDVEVYPSLKKATSSGEELLALEGRTEYVVIPGEEAMNKYADYFVTYMKMLMGQAQELNESQATNESEETEEDGEFEEVSIEAQDVDFSISWEYEDGTPKKETEAASEEEESASEEAAADGYTVYVADDKGNPIEGVMVQICDDTTCQVFFTDDQGMVSCEAGADTYDVHILKVPDGYEKPDDLFSVGKDQPSLSITVKAQ